MKEKKSKKLTFLLGFIVIILLICQIILSNRLINEGIRLDAIQQEAKKYQEDCQLLKNEIASLTSLDDLSEFALENGFIKNPPVVNLSQKIPVAAINNGL
ncbi:hypothetical protein A3J78_00530 [Candidatus Beckwithbacteria bacterium RBG_13_35_6]|uniref:Cell division protein FtsL n=1 Tax=Candidatus Beckwithbacteria bacterium RBG_13_35_6 TaxID=1797456 RepID=A0A1F5DCU7_9BACT|nr:MAG: hypothetical protein A3J78_00530 [Candidatus Beckwithbacteria bacterium RBG_13_35_6]